MRRTLSFLLQLEKNKEILPSMRDDALFCCGISREILPSFLSLERVLDTPLLQLKKFPDIPISTGEEHRRSCHNSRRAPFFPPHLEMRVHFPASLIKESQHSLHSSRGGSLNLKVERNSRGRATIPKKTLMLQFTSDTPDSPALTGQLPRGSTQNTMAVVTALWHLKRQPPIPMSTRQEA